MTDGLTVPNSKSESTWRDPQTILVVAIEELDPQISDLISTGQGSISPYFLDWVADSLTRTIEARLLAALQTSWFKSSLRQVSPRSVLAHWVRHWTCLEIKQEFGHYVKFCPCSRTHLVADILPSQSKCRAAFVAVI